MRSENENAAGLVKEEVRSEKREARWEVSEAARLLGRRGAGVPKRFSAAERERRRRRLAAARLRRWRKSEW